LKVHLHHFLKIKSIKEVTKHNESRFFFLFLLDDRRIRIRSRNRIHTSDKWIWIRIRKAQKHVDPVDSDTDSDPDPEHWLQAAGSNKLNFAFVLFYGLTICVIQILKGLIKFMYNILLLCITL
jgi:hypothetical protein